MADRKTAITTALIGALASVAVSFVTAWATITASGDRIKDIHQEATDLEERITAIPAPVGAILAYGGPIYQPALEKEGWMLCDGRELSRKEYFELFDRIGELWGSGNNVGTFNIPDLRGYFLRGVDNKAGVDPDAASRTNKDKRQTGDQAGTLQGMATGAPHVAFKADDAGTHTHGDPTWNSHPGAYEIATANRGPGGVDYGPESAPTTEGGNHAHTVSGGDKETRPVNAYVHWIIRVR
jgi:microcystin-dependent protein